MALFHAAAIIKFIDMSTGIISPTNWQLVIAVRNNPFPTPTTKPETYAIDLNIVTFHLLLDWFFFYEKLALFLIPLGPFRLSIHPGKGS